MRKNIIVDKKALSDRNLTSNDYRVYTYLQALEKGEEININEISRELRINIKQVMKAIKKLTVLGYTKKLECIA